MNTKHGWLMACALAAVGCGSDEPGIYDRLGDNANGSGRGRDGGADTRRKGDSDGVCGEYVVGSDHAIPDMLIVLDRSSSMAPTGNDRGTNRWAGSARAVSEITARYGTGVSFGLMTFPGQQNGLSLLQCTTGTLDVPIGLDNAAAIQQAISRTGPSGFTPTAATLDAALEVIGSPTFADQGVSSAKYVLLVTDGEPNCSEEFQQRVGGGGFGGGGLFGGGGGVSIEDPLARTQSIEAVERLTEAGVKTFVVGYETAGSSFEDQLDKMAAAGGTGERKHRSVASAEDLAATFEELAARATTCSFRLKEKVDPVYVKVTVGKSQRNYNDDDDGWELLSDEQTVNLLGKACDDAKKGSPFKVEVTCDPVNAI